MVGATLDSEAWYLPVDDPAPLLSSEKRIQFRFIRFPQGGVLSFVVSYEGEADVNAHVGLDALLSRDPESLLGRMADTGMIVVREDSQMLIITGSVW